MDISDILSDWPYDSDACVRKIVAEDGRELLQVRTPLGIEQYELSGRPDGLRPYDCESVLEYVEGQSERHLPGPAASGEFEIDAETAAELQHEGLIYYYRYLICFQIGEYASVISDTYRNLRMFDLLKAWCTDADTVNSSEQYRPYVLRINAAARALTAVAEEQHAQAKNIVLEAVRTIERLEHVPTATFDYERERSLAILRGMLRAIPAEKRKTEADRLKDELTRAITEENYERAAQLRDRLNALGPRERRSHSPSES